MAEGYSPLNLAKRTPRTDREQPGYETRVDLQILLIRNSPPVMATAEVHRDEAAARHVHPHRDEHQSPHDRVADRETEERQDREPDPAHRAEAGGAAAPSRVGRLVPGLALDRDPHAGTRRGEGAARTRGGLPSRHARGRGPVDGREALAAPAGVGGHARVAVRAGLHRPPRPTDIDRCSVGLDMTVLRLPPLRSNAPVPWLTRQRSRPAAGRGVAVPDLMEAVTSLAKRRGIAFQSSEIYGGLRSSWDYGPLGVELRRNLRGAWWRSMVQLRDDVVGLEAAIIMSPKRLGGQRARRRLLRSPDRMHELPSAVPRGSPGAERRTASFAARTAGAPSSPSPSSST